MNPSSVRDIINEKEQSIRIIRLMYSMISQSNLVSTNYDRIISVFTHQCLTGRMEIKSLVVTLPIVELSGITGSTLYKFTPDQNYMLKIGSAGDVGGKDTYKIDDPKSFVSNTYREQTARLISKEEQGFGQKEFLLCYPIGKTYVLTLHCLLEKEFQQEYNPQQVLESLYEKNKSLFGVLNTYLERSEVSEI